MNTLIQKPLRLIALSAVLVFCGHSRFLSVTAPAFGAENSPPVISFASPTNGQVFVGPLNITLTANALDNEGISKVEFFSGIIQIGTATVPPYQAVFEDVQPDTYTLHARATDSFGLMSTSAPVNITVVDNISPPRIIDIVANPNGVVELAIIAQPNFSYLTQVSSDLKTWSNLNTNSSSSWVYSVLDRQAGNFYHRFYRVRKQ